MWLGPTSSRTFVLPSHGLLFPSIRSHVQKAFDPTYFRYLKSRSRLLFNSALAQCLIHGYRSSPRYVVTVITIAIRLVQPSLYLWSIMLSYESRHSAAVLHSTCVPSPPFTSARRFRQESTLLSTSSQSFKLSSRFHPVAVHFRRPLHPRHESQHQSLTGVRPLERAYCHEPCYVSCGLKS
jgi:hypothetical protein